MPTNQETYITLQIIDITAENTALPYFQVSGVIMMLKECENMCGSTLLVCACIAMVIQKQQALDNQKIHYYRLGIGNRLFYFQTKQKDNAKT